MARSGLGWDPRSAGLSSLPGECDRTEGTFNAVPHSHRSVCERWEGKRSLKEILVHLQAIPQLICILFFAARVDWFRSLDTTGHRLLGQKAD